MRNLIRVCLPRCSQHMRRFLHIFGLASDCSRRGPFGTSLLGLVARQGLLPLPTFFVDRILSRHHGRRLYSVPMH
jgi:hypothetical protein